MQWIQPPSEDDEFEDFTVDVDTDVWREKFVAQAQGCDGLLDRQQLKDFAKQLWACLKPQTLKSDEALREKLISDIIHNAKTGKASFHDFLSCFRSAIVQHRLKFKIGQNHDAEAIRITQL